MALARALFLGVFAMKKKNIFYAQSGGSTSVINTSACGVIETARKYNLKVYAGMNGIIGALNENLIDTSTESNKAISHLKYAPGAAFGSCRYKLKNVEENESECKRLIEVFDAHNIGYFFYNGGGDSQDTAYKVSKMCEKIGYPLVCIGIPKTMDNDLPFTDSCPGFGSVAKYLATSVREVGYDLISMSHTSTKIFVLEVMGRHAGWTAAASGLATENGGGAPHLILFPEMTFDEANFLDKVSTCVKENGCCAIVASEGIKNLEGKFVAELDLTDAFGHKQLGGVAPIIAKMIKRELGFKYHFAISDYLQRAARHIASKTDSEQAYALGKAAVEYALAGENNVMTIVIRTSSRPYRWEIGCVPLEKVANVEKKVPRNYISKDGFHITNACRSYLLPLIQGEDYPPFKNGLPQFVKLAKNKVVKKVY